MDDYIRNNSDKEIYNENPHLYEQLYKLLSSMRADFSISTLYQLLDKPVDIQYVQYMLDSVSWAESSEYHIYHYKHYDVTNDSVESSSSEEKEGAEAVNESDLEESDMPVEDVVHEEPDNAEELDRLCEQRKKYSSVLDDKRSNWKENCSKLQDKIYNSTLYIEKLQKEVDNCSAEITQLSFLDFNKKKKLNNVIIGLNREISGERVKRDNLIERLDEENRKYQAEIADIKKQINNIDLEIERIKNRNASDNESEADGLSIDVLDLSVRPYRCLVRAKIDTIGQLKKTSDADLMSIRNMGRNSLKEIHDKLSSFLNSEMDSSQQNRNIEETAAISVSDFPIEELGLSVRSYNCLHGKGIKNVSELFNYTKEDLLQIRNMGEKSADEIMNVVQSVRESLTGESGLDFQNNQATDSSIDDDMRWKYYSSEVFYQSFSKKINTYLVKDMNNKLSFEDIKGMFSLDIDDSVMIDNLKRMVKEDQIINDEGVYRKRFVSVLQAIEDLPDDQADFVKEKIEGKTLKEIGDKAGKTRERIRQIIAKAMNWIRNGHKDIKANHWFAEDRYKYLFETYDIDRDTWCNLDLPQYIYNYLQVEYKHGNKQVSEIFEDDRIDDKIKRIIQEKRDENYIIVGDRRILRNRSAIENYIISIYFRDEGSFNQFVEKYKEFLYENELDNDTKLMISDEVIRTRVNKLALSHNVLWKQNQRIRYYDIDNTDFTTLLDTLCLEQYHNIEISTLKFMRDYPELMDEYDIRDEYELHNLLKKICKPEDYQNIVFERMPGIRFGEFNRDDAVKEIMTDMSPVTRDDLAEAISQKYGFRVDSISGSWLNCLDEYYYNGIYTMPTNSVATLSKELLSDLKECLNEQFYFTDDLPGIIKNTLGLNNYKPSAYELKKCGFKVYSGYILKGYASSSEYFLNMLTATDLVDLSGCDPRMYSIIMFSNILYSLKEDYEIMEYEPYKYINISRLQLMGIDKNDIRGYCRAVKKYVGINNFFTLFWLRNVGFQNKLDDLGFEDYFYESILSADPEIHAFIQRATDNNNSHVLYYGEDRLGKKDFVRNIIKKEKAIDRDDLISYCKKQYNFTIGDKLLYSMTSDSDIYYDKTMERFYSSYSVFFDEL